MNNDELEIITGETHMEDKGYAPVDEYLSRYYSLNSDKEKILLVGHDCNMGGAEILLKNLVKEFIK